MQEKKVTKIFIEKWADSLRVPPHTHSLCPLCIFWSKWKKRKTWKPVENCSGSACADQHKYLVLVTFDIVSVSVSVWRGLFVCAITIRSAQNTYWLILFRGRTAFVVSIFLLPITYEREAHASPSVCIRVYGHVVCQNVNARSIRSIQISI